MITVTNVFAETDSELEEALNNDELLPDKKRVISVAYTCEHWWRIIYEK